MKYNIEGFSQKKLVELKLNSDDAIILRWFVDFYSTDKMTIVKNESGIEYAWVNYQNVIDDLPILEIKNREVIARHFNKLAAAGILEKYVYKIKGVYTCFKLTKKYRELIEEYEGVSTEKSRPIDSKVETPIDSKVETKDYSIIINDSIKYIYTDIFDFWNRQDVLQKHKKLETFINSFSVKKLKRITDEFSVYEICSAISNYNIVLGSDKYYFKHSWSLWDFLSRGLYKFVDSASPLNNFLSKNNKKDKPDFSATIDRLQQEYGK